MLLGGLSNGPYYKWRKDPQSTLDTDMLTRISYLIGIFKALNILYGEKLADEWVRFPNTNPIFGGRTPLAYMMAGGPPALQTVRKLLDAPGRGVSSDLPPTTLVRQFDTHRLIPWKYSKSGDSVLARIAGDDQHFRDLVILDDATNDRLLAENDMLPGIGVHDLVFGLPYACIVNAAFCHAHPLGSRFNGPERGAWYAAFAIETAQAEVAFHRTADYAEISRFEDSVTYDDYLADFTAELHDLRGANAFLTCLAPDSYIASQTLAERLLDMGSLGLVYPNVRHGSGTCLACFRPTLVGNIRKTVTYRFTWSGTSVPAIETWRP